MKLLITGFEGYIGTRLTRSAIKAGHNVTGLDVGFYRDGNLGGGIENPPEIIRKDIRDISAEDLRGFDTVIHLSELSNDPLGENNPALTFEINNKGTKRVAELAKKAGVKRFIYSSSCSVYGASMDLKNESSSVNPLTTYAKCKIFNVGGESSNYTIREIAGIISQALPGCKITLDDTNPDKRNYRVDFRKINT